MSNGPEDRVSTKTLAKQPDAHPPDKPDEPTDAATPESGTSSLLDRLRGRLVRPGTALVLWVPLLAASVVFSTDLLQTDWADLASGLFVPMTVAAFSWWLHLIARARQEKFEQEESSRREGLVLWLEEKRREHEEALQARQAELARELSAREEELARDLEKEYQEFRRRLQDVRQDWQVKLAQQRDRMTARLSIANHVGDVNGHLSAIEGILSAIPQEEPGETADTQDESAGVESTGESAFEISQGVIRVPERVLSLIQLPESEQ